MEEFSMNGKLEDTQKVKSQDEAKGQVIQDSGKLKNETKSETEIDINANGTDDLSSNCRDSGKEAKPDATSPKASDSEAVEKEIVVFSSVVKSYSQPEELIQVEETWHKKTEDTHDDKTELESEENDKPEPEEINRSIGESSASAYSVSKGKVDEPSIQELVSTEEEKVSSNTPEVVEESLQKSVQETSNAPEYDLIRSTAEVQEYSQNLENPKTENSSNKPEASPSNENAMQYSRQPIISLSRRTPQPTSWRNCCGLLDFLRHSDR